VSRLTDLLNQLKHDDPNLAKDLELEFKALSSRRAFGLNFERHRPENVELYQRPVRRGDKVRILPPRGTTCKGDQRLWEVKGIEKQGKSRIANLELLRSDETIGQAVLVCDLVVVAEFRDYVYPGLKSTGKVEQSEDKPHHSVINGENFHALKALTFTHRGQIDAIYIDPPYNTGAKDWKYNNDYVDSEDMYRHSKWLSFMERRLKVAKELLNLEDSVLIVTIDEKEVHRLGLLLEQIFPESRPQLVSIVIQAAGSARKSELGRVEEYAFFIFFGRAIPLSTTDDLLNDAPSTSLSKVRWESLLRSGTGSLRKDSPNLFYPIFIDRKTNKIFGVGESKELEADRKDWLVPAGSFPVWPIKKTGFEGRWRCTQKTLIELLENAYLKAGECDEESGKGTVWYLGKSARNKIKTGEFIVTGSNLDDSVKVEVESLKPKTFPVKTIWNRARHHAGWHGTNLVSSFIQGRNFPFPKSLYSVEDALRIAVGAKKESIVLDFFSGSGTTAHAVMRLNRQDGGNRQSISVTNNEVAAEEQKFLRKDSLRPGDDDWEKWGICEYITKPRIKAAITGKTPEGRPIEGEYKFTDVFPISNGFAENAEFFTLTYESADLVEHNMAFERIAPLLWLRAGSQGRRIESIPYKGWDVADNYGVIEKLDQAKDFCIEVANSQKIKLAYIVTDDDRRFQSIIQHLPNHVEPVRLYESFLTNFQFSNGE
jgi:adenine-specific DNA-methyltransferase